MATNICDSGAGLSVTGCNFFLSFFFKDRLFIFINLSYMHMEGGLATVHQLQRATVTIFSFIATISKLYVIIFRYTHVKN